MLDRQVIQISAGVATLLADKGKTLSVRPDSALDFMVRACPLSGLYTTDGAPPTVDRVVDYLSERAEQQDHCESTDLVVDKASEGVAQLLAFARNAVMPDIRAIYEKIEAGIENARFSVRSPFTIVPAIAPRVYKNPLTAELVERFSETSAADVSLLNLPPLSMEVIEDKIRTGNAEYDLEVKELFSDNHGLARAGEVWSGGIPLNFLEPEYALGVHLLAKGMIDNPPEGTAMPLAEYNAKVAQLIEQSGRIVRQCCETIARNLRQGNLYGGPIDLGAIAEDSRNIRVNNDVYLEYMNKGLTPEALIGNEMLNRQFRAEDLLDESTRQQCEAVYAREMKLRDAKAKVDDFNIARDVLERVFTAEINSRETLVVVPEVLHARLRDRLSIVRLDDMAQLPLLARDLTCHLFYAHTDAHRYICLFDQVGAEEPDLDPRTVGLVALARYVFSWTADQILVQ